MISSFFFVDFVLKYSLGMLVFYLIEKLSE
jgi:hypothetical protein